jgi:hypothetical protein
MVSQSKRCKLALHTSLFGQSGVKEMQEFEAQEKNVAHLVSEIKLRQPFGAWREQSNLPSLLVQTLVSSQFNARHWPSSCS